uniref:COX assembly mitochondrial protein n=1 Tax=Globodera rostochiensis TaxID=31243 RepID=A0A914GYG8_GLORO
MFWALKRPNSPAPGLLTFMLPDLSSHLHTEECNFLINIYRKCQKESPLFKRYFMRECSYWYTAIGQCLRQERLLRKATNPKYGKRLIEAKRLPEEKYTPALRKLKEKGELILDESNRGGCSI